MLIRVWPKPFEQNDSGLWKVYLVRSATPREIVLSEIPREFWLNVTKEEFETALGGLKRTRRE
jgi:hypothetical protein